MALQVWLPLNGDLRNLGAANINFKSGTPSFSDDGKIGKCMSTGDAIFNLPETLFDSISETNTFSFACWCKDKKGSGKNRAFWLGDGNKRIRGYYENRVAANLNWAYASTGQDVPINIDVLDGEWHHIVFASDGVTNKLTVYIDGIFQNEIIQNYTMSLGGTKTLSLRTTDKKLNDFRLYDHCLSALEVKEISQGLVLHYKLDDLFIANYVEDGNLLPNYKDMQLGSANVEKGIWRYAGASNMTRNRVKITDSPIGECYCFQNSGIQTANDGSCYGIDSTTYFEPNTEYKISMFARVISGTEANAGFCVYNIEKDLDGSYTKIDRNYRVTPLKNDGSWTYCWYHFKTNWQNTRNIYIGITTGETEVITQMCLVRIDKWSSQLDSNIIADSSGYGHHGQMYGYDSTGTIKNVLESPRYKISTHIQSDQVSANKASGTQYIYGHCGLTNPTCITVSFWCKPIEYGYAGNLNHGLFCTTNFECGQLKSYDYLDSTMNHRDGAIDINDSQSNSQCRVIIRPTLNEWQHFVIVYDGQIGKVYKNGVLASSSQFSEPKILDSFIGIVIGFSFAGGVWRKNNAYYSDFRIYATALDEKAIKKLYNTPTEIDKNHGYHTMELDETFETISLQKNGISGSNTFEEEDSGNTFYKNNKIGGSILIEK